MRFTRTLFLLSLPLGLLSLFGCAHVSASSYQEAPPGQLLSPPPNFDTANFSVQWPRPLSERDKINYLLDRIAHSENQFIRNSEIYDGKAARGWFLYKRAHWVQGEVGTAEDFIKRVTTFSQKTGKLYLVKSSEGEIFTVRSVLKNELSALEAHTHSAPAEPTA